jgi:predicted lipoprotein with Yx(FWY)xxD motif
MRNRWWAAPGAAAALALLAACGSSAASGGSSAASAPVSSAPASSSATTGGGAASTSATGLKTASSGKGTILETAQGYTVYWFAIDTPGKSNCTGTCATYWPPLIGKPSAADSSLSGTFGTIKRADGQLQATYMGHPLYLYKGDTAPGQVHGNGINTSGGLWWAMTPTGAKLTAASPAPSKSSSGGGGGGYGY